MSVYHGCAVPEEAREGIRSPRTGITGDCDSPRECWVLNPGPLHEGAHFSY